MLGAIVGDVIGSVHEWARTKTKDFELFSPGSTFTDDSVLTVAVAEWILDGGDLAEVLRWYATVHPGRGYGGMFNQWVVARDRKPYKSYGNGSAMRVSPVGFAFDTLDEVLAHSKRSADVTHNHREGIRGAQATAAAIYLARTGKEKDEIRRLLEKRFHYDLHTPLDQIRPTYEFDVTCQGSVPPAMACIAGGIAEAYYGAVPPELEDRVRALLDPRLVSVVDRFRERFPASAKPA